MNRSEARQTDGTFVHSGSTDGTFTYRGSAADPHHACTTEHARLRSQLHEAREGAGIARAMQDRACELVDAREAELAGLREHLAALEQERDSLIAAAAAFESDLSDYCDGPERDVLRTLLAPYRADPSERAPPVTLPPAPDGTRYVWGAPVVSLPNPSEGGA